MSDLTDEIPQTGSDRSAKPREKTLFEAPPIAEQERMVEAISVCLIRACETGRAGRAHAAWLRSGGGNCLPSAAL